MWREEVVNFFAEHKKPQWWRAHACRIQHLARELATENRCDDDILFAVAILHDLDDYPQYRCTGIDHSVNGGKSGEPFLKKIDFPSSKMHTVLDVIEMHVFDSEPGSGLEPILRG